jgi:hypothetical protein
MRMLDMLGLTDEYIARHGRRDPEGSPGHIAYDFEYVVAQRPDLVYPVTTGLDRHPLCGPYRHFDKAYDTLAYRDLRSGRWANFMVRKDEVEQLEAALDQTAHFERVSCSADRAHDPPPLFPEY